MVCTEADQRACFHRRLAQCLKSHWAEIERRFGKRSARFEVTVELQRGPRGEMLSRIQGSDPKPVPGRERFEAPGSSKNFKATDECFFVMR
jgi:hypothetical protein